MTDELLVKRAKMVADDIVRKAAEPDREVVAAQVDELFVVGTAKPLLSETERDELIREALLELDSRGYEPVVVTRPRTPKILLGEELVRETAKLYREKPSIDPRAAYRRLTDEHRVGLEYSAWVYDIMPKALPLAMSDADLSGPIEPPPRAAARRSSAPKPARPPRRGHEARRAPSPQESHMSEAKLGGKELIEEARKVWVANPGYTARQVYEELEKHFELGVTRSSFEAGPSTKARRLAGASGRQFGAKAPKKPAPKKAAGAKKRAAKTTPEEAPKPEPAPTDDETILELRRAGDVVHARRRGEQVVLSFQVSCDRALLDQVLQLVDQVEAA